MIKNANPKVSIICLTYNHEKYIKNALDSFLMQKVNFNMEIIIHDDSSTDKTIDIIKEYQKSNPNIIKAIIQKENQRSIGGNVFANAYNVAQGKYIAYCEGDDYWMDDKKIAIQVEFLENNPDYVITYSDCEPVFEEAIMPRSINATARDLSPEELIQSPSIHSLSVCFRRVIEIPKELGFVEYGDLFLWSLLGSHGAGKYLNSFAKSRYRVHNNGVHSNKSVERKYEMLILTFALMLRYYRRIGDNESATKFRKKIIIETLKFNLKKIKFIYKIVTLIKSINFK